MQGTWPLASTELEKQQQKQQPPTGVLVDPPYKDYIERLRRVAHENWNSGIHAILPVLLGDGEDPNQIITGVAVLMNDPLTKLLAQGLVDALDQWEHAERLHLVLDEIDPENHGDD